MEAYLHQRLARGIIVTEVLTRHARYVSISRDDIAVYALRIHKYHGYVFTIDLLTRIVDERH